MIINFYTRNNCMNCDDGEIQLALALEDYPDVTVEKIDIDTSDALQQKYMLEVPVVEHNGNVIQYGQIDFVTIIEYLQKNIETK
ncbi:MAG TPA: glutaredoxin family protein [Aliicoccus persicus]|uniref:Glutaredoxin family protein n=1 Tax=Aliicoccus persicus TaxID=930138 RepID=A0A921B4W3_9STAP|nr:glutaredoxin family protein [Aliicoccus persicus]